MPNSITISLITCVSPIYSTMQLISFISFTVLFGSAIAAPACVGNGYATFYNDNACTKNPGQAVSMGNSGCLANEIGRNSIYIQGSCGGAPSLVWSPGTNCNCQNECKAVPNPFNNHCWNLNGNKGASSFRFIEQGCGANNC